MKTTYPGNLCSVVLVFFVIVNLSLNAQNNNSEKFEYRGNARVNVKTGVTAALYNVDSHVYQGTSLAIAKQFLNENKAKFGMSNITDLKHLETIKSPAGSHVGFLQTYNGIPVFGSETVVSINKENRVTMVVNGNNPVTGLKLVTAGVSKESAMKKAVAAVNAEEETFVMKPKAELYIYRDTLDNYTLTWKVNFIAQKPHGDWQVFIDANNGAELMVMDISVSYGTGEGRVFKPDPITNSGNIYLSNQGNTDYNNFDLQNAYKEVTLSNLNEPDSNGIYRLWGQYARSDSIVPPNTQLVRRTDSLFLYKRNQAGFEETNAYYFIDLQRQYIGTLGFSPKWNNEDYIRFDAHGHESSDNNSGYIPTLTYIEFGSGSNTRVEGAEDLSIVLHEYGHAVHDALMIGTGIRAESLDEWRISEGSSDYLAVSYRKTLSTIQENIVFPWWQNVTDVQNPQVQQKIGLDNYSVSGWAGWGRQMWGTVMMDIEGSIGRDITTTLLLTSFSYVTPSSYLRDHINAIFRADIDVYGGTHFLEIFNAFNNRGFFVNDQVSGTISSNATWSVIKVVTGNVTVTSGANLTVSPGTFVFFTNGSSLSISNNSLLTANGSLSSPITFYFFTPNSSTQNGIVINNSSSGTINYCRIRNAYRGIYENNVSINITNTAISGCMDGIYLSYSNPVIVGCNIHHNSNAGVNVLNSSPTLYMNYIQYNTTGVYCSSNSSPLFGTGSTSGGNDIRNNSVGVANNNNTNTPRLGNTSPTVGGYNNLVNYTNNVANSTANVIYARNNWWGTTNPAYFFILGPVTYSPYRSSQETIPQPPLSKENNNLAESLNEDIPLLSELDKAYQLVDSKNFTEAREICLNLVNNYPDYSVSFNALNLLKETYTENELSAKKNIFETLSGNKSKKDLYAIAGVILSDIDKDNKLKHLDDVLENYKEGQAAELAMFNKFVYYYFELEDIKIAREISKQLDERFPKSNASIEAHKILGDEEYFGMNANNKQVLQKEVAEVPKEFMLYDNYPNPFNPATVIKYAIPQNSKVVLEVYNTLGEKVAALVNEAKSAGFYETSFDGSNLSSGIYIYRLTASSLETGEQFVKSAKMILIK